MSNRDRIVVGVVACLVAVAGFWFLALKPKREEVAAAGARAAEAQTRLQAATQALASASSAKESFVTDYATVARLSKAVPDDDDAASLVFQISAAARKAGIDFRSLTVGGSGAAAPPSTPAPSTGSGSGSGSSKSPAGGSAAAPTTTLAPGVVAGADGMNRLPFTFIFDGDYFALTRLLDLLRSFTTVKGDTVTVRGRLLTVEGVNLEEGRKGFPNVKATITATAYLSSVPLVIPGGSPAEPAQAAGQAAQAPSTAAAGVAPSVPAATATPGVVR
jgi:hypothetical protein